MHLLTFSNISLFLILSLSLRESSTSVIFNVLRREKTTCTRFRGGLATEALDLVSLLVSPFCVTHPPAAPSAQPLTEQLGFGQAKDTDGRCWGAWPKGLPPPRRPPTSNYIVAPRPSHRLPHGQWQQHWD